MFVRQVLAAVIIVLYNYNVSVFVWVSLEYIDFVRLTSVGELLHWRKFLSLGGLTVNVIVPIWLVLNVKCVIVATTSQKTLDLNFDKRLKKYNM